jgi:Fe-S oxidoreductase
VKLSDTPFTERVDVARLAKPCATCGKCNSVCPVYDVAREESNSSRGWFHVLTAADYAYERDARVVEACINCKSCLEVCPAGIDVSRHALARRAEHPNAAAGWAARALLRPQLFEPALGPGGDPAAVGSADRAGSSRRSPGRSSGGSRRPRASARAAPAETATRTLRSATRLTEEADARARRRIFTAAPPTIFDDGVGDAVIGLLARRGLGPSSPPGCSGTPIQTYGQTGP